MADRCLSENHSNMTMDTWTRKLPVRAIAISVLSILWLGCSRTEEPADIVLKNGAVYTMDIGKSWAEAVALKDQYIVAVGTDAEVDAFIGPDTRVIDLDGAFVSPGFNDGHVHVGSTGSLLMGVNLLDVHEPVGFAERIRKATERMPAGSLISRGSWGAYEQWEAGSDGSAPGSVAGGPFTPHRDLIDEFTGEHPVLVSRFDGSMHLANRKALEIAGVLGRFPDPPGGKFDRDESGRLTGILRGSAYDRVQKMMPPKSFELRMAEFEALQQEARSAGVTTIQDLTTPEMMRVYQQTRENGDLTVRVMLRPTLFMVDHLAGLGITQGFGDRWLKYVGMKAWVDGIMGASSALFFRPYDHMPEHVGSLRTIMFPEGRRGAGLAMSNDEQYTDFPPGNLEQLIETSLETGIPPHVHAIGDKGVQIILDIYEKILTNNNMIESDHRWRIIHAQVVDQPDFERFGQLNLVAEINPYHVSDDMRWMEERIGAERSRGAYAFRDLADAGAVLVFGSDSPGTNAARYYLSPVYGLYAAVTRQTLDGEPPGGWFPEQRLTIEEAMQAYTINPAWASFEEDIKGSLIPGKLADLVVFDTNLIEAGHNDPQTLLEARVLYTIVDGKVVYESDQGFRTIR